MKTIIAGSWNGFTYEDVVACMKKISWKPTEVVSGHCNGVDLYGEKWAKMRKIPVRIFYTDWATQGKAAGMERNLKMAQYADAAVILWDGESRGAEHLIFEARKQGLMIYLHAKQEEMNLVNNTHDKNS